MRLVIITLLALMNLQSSFACSLEMSTETLLGSSAGSVCAHISDIQTDQRGPYRVFDYDVVNRDGELEEYPSILLRPKMSRPLRRVEVIGLGAVNLMVLRVNSMSSATVKFLNGNSINIEIGENGEMSPDKICVRQISLRQLRGFPGECP